MMQIQIPLLTHYLDTIIETDLGIIKVGLSICCSNKYFYCLQRVAGLDFSQEFHNTICYLALYSRARDSKHVVGISCKQFAMRYLHKYSKNSKTVENTILVLVGYLSPLFLS